MVNQAGSGSKNNYNYNKINDPDASNTKGFNELPENMEDDFDEDEAPVAFDNKKLGGGKREHELYEGTYYIPNDKLRLLEVPMNSSLMFQMLLYYHWFFDILYGFLLIISGIYKVMIGNIAEDPLSIVSMFMTIMSMHGIGGSSRHSFGVQVCTRKKEFRAIMKSCALKCLLERT